MNALVNKNNQPKVVLIGSTAVGKTSLIRRLTENKFDNSTTPTTGTAFFQLKTENPDHPDIQIWDTAGLERYRSLNRIFYHEAVGALLVFDLTNARSFMDLESWLDEFVTEAPLNPSIVLLGNKSDRKDEFEVENDEILSFANEHGLKYYPTSAATGEGVNEMLQYFLSILPKSNNVDTTNIEVQKEESGCC